MSGVLSELPPGYGLASEDVHVWVTRTGWPPDHIRAAAEHLSLDERQHAGRFHFRVDTERHIVGRALARLLLGGLLGMHPRSLLLDKNGFGKPQLADAQNANGIQFNISHSGDFVLVALALGREVGVDVEQLDPKVELEQIALLMFSRGEVDDLASLPAGERLSGFFRCWSRKEAFIKAHGEGLSMPLDQFDVSLKRVAPVVVPTPGVHISQARRWTIRDVDVGPGYAAAVAAEGVDWRLKRIEWEPAARIAAGRMLR